MADRRPKIITLPLLRHFQKCAQTASKHEMRAALKWMIDWYEAYEVAKLKRPELSGKGEG